MTEQRLRTGGEGGSALTDLTGGRRAVVVISGLGAKALVAFSAQG